MAENEFQANEEIFSKALRAGRRTYFFDVRATKAGDYYLTITESKKFSQDSGENEYKKHKIYLYKEDFEAFRAFLNEATDFILREKGTEVISERHIKDFKKTFVRCPGRRWREKTGERCPYQPLYRYRIRGHLIFPPIPASP